MKWFYEEYLLNEFKIKNFKFNVTTENATYLEKCLLLCNNIEYVLKQFSLLVEEREIDHELLQISYNSTLINNVPSFLNNKYIYPNGEEFDRVSKLLFSNQSSLLYLKEKYDSFFDMIQLENINIKDFNDDVKSELIWLIENKYIKTNDFGVIKINTDEVYILQDLYFNDVVCSIYFNDFTDIIMRMKQKNIIRYGTSLLSEPEQDWYNYIMNHCKYTNALDLRNRYSHATQPNPDEEMSHKKAYYTFIKILILLAIKINEEVCEGLDC